jgi:arylsulfatase A-like enzyme
MPQKDFYKSREFKEGRELMVKHLNEWPTLPKLLGQAGYASLQTGKWWLGDYSTGGFTAGMSKGGRHGDEGLDIGRKTMQPIQDFIAGARKESKPFFIWYAPLMPHDPHTPPERLLKKYRDKVPSVAVAKYWAMVEWFDESCGELFTCLEREGLAKDTIVVYVADNGWKLIVPPPQADHPEPELYQVSRDPHEMQNLAAGEAGRVARMRAKLDAWWPGK